MQFAKQKRMIIIGVVIIAATAAYFILYHPLIIKVRGASTYCHIVESDLKIARETAAFFKEETVKRMLVSDRQVSSAIEELTQAGKAKSINFISIAPQKTQPLPDNPSYKVLPVQVEISGAYENLGGFMGELDSFEKSVITVNNFRLAADKKNTSKIEAKLVLNMYLAGE